MPDFFNKVGEIWNKEVNAKSNMDKWCIKVNKVKKFLRGWGQSIKGHNRKYKKILQEELKKLEILEEQSSLSTNLLERKIFIQKELVKFLEEESYWHRRSNYNWLLKRDNNTAYFHRIANGKKRKHTIFCLQSENGSIEGDELISDHATQYYKNLFGPSINTDMYLDSNCWEPGEKVSEEENRELTKNFTMEEIKLSVISMGKKHCSWA